MSDDAEILAAFDETAIHTYRRADGAVFRKTAETWGEFSNMAGGFPLRVNGVRILTSEALYQACRFPHLPDVQKLIIAQPSPMSAKMKGKPHRKDSRPDFDSLRVPIMWWCLRVKLACNSREFSRLLRASGERPIVEDSHKDAYWGALAEKENNQVLTGSNVLGRLLVHLRDLVQRRGLDALLQVEPPPIADFLLYGEPIRAADGAAR